MLRLVAWCAVIPLLCAVAISLNDLKGGWDDGAITAAFSRTWVQSGRIALTPLSQAVEGFSSLAWFALLAVPHLFTQRPEALVIWMKLLSAASASLLLMAFYRVSNKEMQDPEAATASVLIMALSSPLFFEIQDGMEMNLAAVLLVMMFSLLRSTLVPRSRIAFAWFLGSLLLLTRFESPYWLTFLLCGLWFEKDGARPSRRKLLALASGLLLSFVLIELWRHHRFSLWAPNTVYAKQWLPYQDRSTLRALVETRLRATGELLDVFPAALVIVLIAVATRFLRRLPLEKAPSISATTWALSLGVCLFGILFGANWGHSGRMIWPALPFFVLALLHMSNRSVSLRRKSQLTFFLVFFQGLAWFVLIASYRGRGPVSIAAIERKGRAADFIRSALGRDSVSVMLPDVGGSSLCCKQLNVIDSALLADPYLAHHGWTTFADYFRKVNPDVVETHSVWAELSHIYQNGLLDHYRIVGSNGERFFVRNDLYRSLVEQRAGKVVPVEDATSCLKGQPGEATDADEAFSRSKDTCLVLESAKSK